EGKKGTYGKMAQPKMGKTPLLPDAEQRPIQGEPHRVIALFNGNSDAFAEVAAVYVRPATEGTAILGISAVEPEGERDRIAEQEIDIPAPQGEPRHVRARISANFGLGKQGLKICFMRRAGDHGDLLALKPLGQRIVHRGIALRPETRRRARIGIG